MSQKVAVFGATGAQGGSVARELGQDKDKWKVVAITRDPYSEKAKALERNGAELCKADLSKPKEVEACVKVRLETHSTNHITTISAVSDPSFFTRFLDFFLTSPFPIRHNPHELSNLLFIREHLLFLETLISGQA